MLWNSVPPPTFASKSYGEVKRFLDPLCFFVISHISQNIHCKCPFGLAEGVTVKYTPSRIWMKNNPHEMKNRRLHSNGAGHLCKMHSENLPSVASTR